MVNLRNKKGISLIVLVITIIVMIILAAAIILSLNSSGIIGKANEAKTKSDLANISDYVSTLNVGWELMSDTERTNYTDFVGYANQKVEEKGYKEYVVSYGGKVHAIPEGFKKSIYAGERTVNEGLVIYDTNGVELPANVDTAKTTYNQFVWVPVEEGTFERKTFSFESTLKSDHIEPYKTSIYKEEETEYNKMVESVLKYGGFYIARYEAGDGDVTTARTSVTPAHTVVSKKDAQIYNYVPWGKSMTNVAPFTLDNIENVAGAVYLSRNMYKNNRLVVSHLIYGVEWDAALTFMQDSSHGMGGSSSWENWGNYSLLIGTTGVLQEADLQTSGKNEAWKAKNIYDMAGNVWEWTMEAFSSGQRMPRGGSYIPGTAFAADHRNCVSPYRTTFGGGFRSALYLV